MVGDGFDGVHRVTFCAGEQRWTVGLVPIPRVTKTNGAWYTIHALEEDGTLATRSALSICHDHFGVLNVCEEWPFRQAARNDVDCWVLDFPKPGDVCRWGRVISAGEYLTPRQAARRCSGLLGRKVAAAKVLAMAMNGHLMDVIGGRPGEPVGIWEAELPKVVATLAADDERGELRATA